MQLPLQITFRGTKDELSARRSTLQSLKARSSPVATRAGTAHEDVYVAIRDAFDAIGRKLQDRVRRARGDVKSHEAAATGRVVQLFPDDGYGFIETDEGLEVYFHEHSVPGKAFGNLALASRLRLVVAEDESPRGPQASTVELSER